MIDTHCHFEFENEEELEEELKAIKESGVEKIIVSCCTKEEQEKNIPFLIGKEGVYLALGYHPEEVDQIKEEDYKKLEEKLKNLQQVVAVGEIGLDYHYTKENKKQQQALFERQLEIASKYHLPVVIHSREATEETIQILKKYPAIIGVIHCFSGSYETAQIYIKMGYRLGIGGVVTFKNSHLKDVVQLLPLEKIVLETDSPYLAPNPYRGQRNSPKYLPLIAESIASIKQISLEEVQLETTKNAIETFDLSS